MTVRCFVLLCLLWSASAATADVFKCVNEAGRASYKDTSCLAGETDVVINRDYANELDIGIATEDARTIESILRERQDAESERVRQRNESIRKRLKAFREKEARCKLLKAELEEMHIRYRRYGRGDPDAESDLTRRMRTACSG